MSAKSWSKTWTFFENQWREGNPAIVGPRSNGLWVASTVFDGARAFEGTAPDLDRHLARINRSAEAMGLKPPIALDTWMELAKDGLKRFDRDAALYIKPMVWAEHSGVVAVGPDPDSTRWCLCLYELPMPPQEGQSITLSPFRKPGPDTAPTEAKAACLYPNNARAALEAHRRGFDNAVMLDPAGNVAELASSNIFMAKDGVVFTPVPNGTFLDGITRRRVIRLLRGDGVDVVEKSLAYRDFETADEIFSTGNFAKVHPVRRIGARELPAGPLYAKARALYWEFAHDPGRS